MLLTAYTPHTPDRARITAILCAVLALSTSFVTAWFVVEGITATEPGSGARWAKVAAGVLLLALELGAFGVAAQWIEHSRPLRALGWFVLALEIVFMSLAQVSIGTTAGKAAAAASGTLESRTQQAADYRKAAALLEAEAATLKASKHPWKRAQGEQKATEAAALNARAAAAVEARASEATSETAISTPLVQIVGERGLVALSVALSLALSLGGIVFMHTAGALWRQSSGEVVPVEVQILELLHELRGATLTQAHPLPAIESAPAPRLSADASIQTQQTQAGASKVTQTQTQRRPRRDTGTDQEDGSRFARIRDAIKAGALVPGLRAIQDAENCGAPVARRYLARLEEEGLLQRSGRVWSLKQ